MAIESLPTPAKFISKLFESRIQAHIYHLQTNSFAAHKALDEFYNDIVGHTDDIVETFQGGKSLIIKGYKPGIILEDNDPLSYMTSLLLYIKDNRYKAFDKNDTDIQNIIDETVSLTKSTIYKLKFLK